MKYICSVCGFEYEESIGCPNEGIAENTPWENVPEDFVCPICSAGKDMFIKTI